MSRATPTSICGTRRTTTRRCSPCSAASPRSSRRCGSTCPSPRASGCSPNSRTSSTSASSSRSNYAGDPAGTQQAVNHIRETMYAPGPSGLDNNDDLGANSSAFIWEMLGMYPENSGIDTLTLTSPGFPHASIKLANGHDDHDRRARRLGEPVLRQVAQAQRQELQQALGPVLQARRRLHAGLDARLLGHQLGQRQEGRAALLHGRHPSGRRVPARPEGDDRSRREHRSADRRPERDRQAARPCRCRRRRPTASRSRPTRDESASSPTGAGC